MPPPSKVKVGIFVYSVQVGGPDWKAAVKKKPSAGGRLAGHTDNLSLTISVRPGLAPGAEREVVVHELLHACVNVAGQPIESMRRKCGLEENAVSVIAPTLLGVIRENPPLLRYLTARTP